MSTKLDHIHQGDCIKGLAKLDEGSIDLAFADPPFNIGYDYDEYDDKRQSNDYLDWTKQWIAGVKRVLKPDGAFWLAIGDEYAAELKVLCTRELGLHMRNWVVWFYTFGVHCKHKFTRSHAHLFYFVKDPKKFTFNSLDVRVPSARQLVYADKRSSPEGRVPDDTWMMPPVLAPDVATKNGFILRPQDIPEKFPKTSDTWYYARVAGTFNERQGFHGCQMPEQLLGRIINACSDKGEVVLDPFGGSGTTLAVAKKLNRRFIGFELSKEYARNIRKRLATISPGDPLDGPENGATSAPRTGSGRSIIHKNQLDSRVATRSPILVQANASLGQIAVANGEYATAVAEAFMASHSGYSSDRVIADPALNEHFAEMCGRLGIPGGPREWNKQLYGLRKRGALSCIPTTRRPKFGLSSMDRFVFASEIAWRAVGKKFDCSLDDILCDPELSARFDVVSRDVSPGFSAFQYRWAALTLRKFIGTNIENLLPLVDGRFAPRTIPIEQTNNLPNHPGNYLVAIDDTKFYVGVTHSLRTCPFLCYDRVAAAAECLDIRPPERTCSVSVKFRLHKWPNEAAARRARLIERYNPIANVA